MHDGKKKTHLCSAITESISQWYYGVYILENTAPIFILTLASDHTYQISCTEHQVSYISVQQQHECANSSV